MEFKCPEKKFKLNFTKQFVILNQNQNITFVLSSYAKNGVLGGGLWCLVIYGYLCTLVLLYFQPSSPPLLFRVCPRLPAFGKIYKKFSLHFSSAFVPFSQLTSFHCKLFVHAFLLKIFCLFFDRSKLLFFFSIFGTDQNLIDGINSQMRQNLFDDQTPIGKQ